MRENSFTSLIASNNKDKNKKILLKVRRKIKWLHKLSTHA
jgi:hypothetical protein